MFSLPSLGDFFGFLNLYPMKLYEKGKSLDDLPCVISEYSIKQDWELPSEPLENSEFIGDTQYRQPKTISLKVFVKNENITNFERQIKNIQANKNGFVFVDRDGEQFNDFWLISYDKTHEANNGYFYSIELKELILIEAFNSAVSYQQTSNPGLSGKKRNGEVSNNKVSNNKKSVLKSGIDWAKK